MMRYSSEGNDSNERQPVLSEQERHEDFQRHKEELKKKPRRKKRASSSMQSSTFQGEWRGLQGIYCELRYDLLNLLGEFDQGGLLLIC